MRHLKEIKPYSRFWGNCITNMFVSILHEKEPSYEHLIYLNAYEYSYSYDGYFHIEYTKEFYDYFKDNIFLFQRCNFTDKNNFLAEFKEILINHQYVTLNVDLFYWNDEGSFYNKLHMPHFSFVIGFDEEEDVFFVMEENANLNYRIKEIPSSNVIAAVQSSYRVLPEDYRIITFKNDSLEAYTLDKNQLVSNAKRLLHNLDKFINKKNILDKNSLINNPSKVDFYGNEFGKISYRLLGNVFLFEAMRDHGLINGTLAGQFIIHINEISKKWMIVKNLFLKYCKSNHIQDIDKVEKRITDLFIKEKELWLTFIVSS